MPPESAKLHRPTDRPEPRRRRSETGLAYLYLAPAASILLVFWFIPVVLSLIVSFTNWEGADTVDIVSFVGARNYARTLNDEQFWRALGNTLNYALYSVPLTLGLALGAALLVHQKMRASALFRTIFFLPYVSTWVSVSIVWRYFFDVRVGPLNYALTEYFGLSPLRWLEEPRGIFEMAFGKFAGANSLAHLPVVGSILAGPSLAMTSIIATTIWRDVGFYMVIFLAGLTNIDPAYFDAAKIDGAGAWQRLRRVTLPLLTPTTFFCLLVATIGAFHVFVPILVMTPGGGPGKTTSTLIFYMYEKSFAEWKLGQGAAVAYVLVLIVCLLTLAQNRLLGRRVHYEQ